MHSSSPLSRSTLWFAACTAVAVAAFWDPLRHLTALSLTLEPYSHILFIPFLSAGLIWMNRKTIFKEPVAGNPWLAAGLALCGTAAYGMQRHFSSSLSENASLEVSMVALLCLVWAAFLLFYGHRIFRAGAFPLLFLTLIIPIPSAILQAIVGWLQAGSANVTYWLFRATGTPVQQNGVFLSVPGVTIEVARECSGIHSSIALFILCLVGGYLLLARTWARIALLATALLMCFLKNAIRIATLTLLATHVDPSFLTGRLHHQGGFVFFGIGMLLLLPVLTLLQKTEGTHPPAGGVIAGTV